MKKAITPEEMTALCALAGKSKSNSAQHQKHRVLEYLLTNATGINRYEAERDLGICHLAARIIAIKKMGYTIRRVSECVPDSYGHVHSGIARYFIADVDALKQEAA